MRISDEQALANLRTVALGLGETPEAVQAVLDDLTGGGWVFVGEAADAIRGHALAGRKLELGLKLVRSGIWPSDLRDIPGV